MDRSELLDKLATTATGRAVMANAVAALDSGIASSYAFSEALDKWTKYLSKPSTTITGGVNQLIGYLDKLSSLGGMPLPAGESFDPVCHPKTGADEIKQYVFVVRLDAFLDYVVAPAERARLLAKLNLHNSNEPTTEDFRRTVNSLDLNLAIRGLGNPIKKFWFSRWDELEKSVRSLVNGADQARDNLGLHHGKESPEIELVAVIFASESLATTNTARPTFVEAGDNPRFMAVARTLFRKSDEKWGCTADLSGLAAGSLEFDGLPERIAKPVTTPGLFARFQLLGPVINTRGTSPTDDDEAFAKTLELSLTSALIVERLKTI